jgi:hypothetical protein
MKSNFLSNFLYSLFKMITEGISEFSNEIDGWGSKSIALSPHIPSHSHPAPKQIRSGVNFAIFKTSFNWWF